GLAVGPADAETEIDIAHEFFHTVRGGKRVFRRQSYELHVASCISLSYFLVLRNFSTARTAPGGPDVYHYDFAVEVREAEAATIEHFNFPLAQTLRQGMQRGGRLNDGSRLKFRFRVDWRLHGRR